MVILRTPICHHITTFLPTVTSCLCYVLAVTPHGHPLFLSQCLFPLWTLFGHARIPRDAHGAQQWDGAIAGTKCQRESCKAALCLQTNDAA